ncbi:unnamed protein product, partial [Mycena citricolor]
SASGGASDGVRRSPELLESVPWGKPTVDNVVSTNPTVIHVRTLFVVVHFDHTGFLSAARNTLLVLAFKIKTTGSHGQTMSARPPSVSQPAPSRCFSFCASA